MRQSISFIILMGLQAVAFSQSVALSIGSGSGTAGGKVSLPISMSTSGGATSADFQFSLSYTSDISGVTVAVGSSASSAAKSVSCSTSACLVYGSNSNGIPNGTIAVATFQIAAKPSSTTIPITVSGITASTAAGDSMTVSPSSASGAISLAVTLSSLSCSPATVSAPGSSLCTVTLAAPALSTGATVALASNNANITVPASVSIGSGQTSSTFTAAVAAVSSNQTALLSATFNGGSQTFTLSASVAAQLSSLSCTPSTLASNASTTCTVALSQAASVATTVALSSNSALLTVPANVTVPAAQSSATFTATAGTVSWSKHPHKVTVTASLNGQTQSTTISLTPVVSLLNSADARPEQSCSPGSLATVAGAGFTGRDLRRATQLPFPTQLDGLEVSANGTPLPILAATDSLIQFQCPVLPPGTEISLVVSPRAGQPTEPLVFRLQEATPGLFSVDDTRQGAVFIAGTDLLAMPTTKAMPSRPAQRDESLTIYANGLGPLQQELAVGVPAPLDHLVETVDKVVVVVGGVPLTPSFAGLAPGFAGLNQVNVRLSPEVPIGAAIPLSVQVVFSDGTVAQSNTVTVAIQDSLSQ